MKNLRNVSCAFLVLAFGAIAGRAEIVTFEFSGSLATIQDEGNVLPDWLAVGAPASVSLRYDTATPDLYPENPLTGIYKAPGWLLFDVGGLKFERTTWVDLNVVNPPVNQVLFSASATGEMSTWATPFDPTDRLLLSIYYYELELPYLMLSGDAPPTAINFSEASYSGFGVYQMKADRTVEYSLGLNLTPVPEPATWALLGLVLAGLCWQARRH